MSIPRSARRSSTLRSDSGYLTYIITTRRMTSGELLNIGTGCSWPELTTCRGAASVWSDTADDPIQATQTGGNWRFQTSPIAVPSGWELWRSGEGAKSVFVSPLRRWTLPFRQGFARVELEVRRTQTISITMIPTTAEPANNPINAIP